MNYLVREDALEFDAIGAGFRGGGDEVPSLGEIAAMAGSDLGNHQSLAGSVSPVPDGKRSGHMGSVSFLLARAGAVRYHIIAVAPNAKENRMEVNYCDVCRKPVENPMPMRSLFAWPISTSASPARTTSNWR